MKYAIGLLSWLAVNLLFVPVAHAQPLGQGDSVAERPTKASHQAFRDSRQRPASAKLQVEDTLQEGIYTLNYTFRGEANEMIVVYWEGISADVRLTQSVPFDPTPSYFSEGQAYSLPNLELGEQVDNHRLFQLEAAGEYQLTLSVGRYTDRPSDTEDPRYFVRVRSALEAEQLSAQVAALTAERFSGDTILAEGAADPFISVASALMDRVIAQEPDLPQPHLQRALLWLPYVYANISFNPDLFFEEVLAAFQALPATEQASVVSDFRQAAEKYAAIAAIEDGFFAGKSAPKLLREAADFLETSIPSPYLEFVVSSAFDAFYYRLMF